MYCVQGMGWIFELIRPARCADAAVAIAFEVAVAAAAVVEFVAAAHLLLRALSTTHTQPQPRTLRATLRKKASSSRPRKEKGSSRDGLPTTHIKQAESPFTVGSVPHAPLEEEKREESQFVSPVKSASTKMPLRGEEIA